MLKIYIVDNVRLGNGGEFILNQRSNLLCHMPDLLLAATRLKENQLVASFISPQTGH